MTKEFNSIEDFIKFRERCVFCKQPLKPTLSNFTGSTKKIPVISSQLKDYVFEFKIDYTSADSSVKAKGSIDIKSDEIKFDIEPGSYNLAFPNTVDYPGIIFIFEALHPHIEMSCNNKSCGMRYYICTDIFKCERASAARGGHYYNFSSYTRIKPFLAYYEACNVGRYWVQSDWIKNKTCIYSTTNPNAEPIVIPLLDFDFFDKEKLKCRIKTIATFT